MPSRSPREFDAHRDSDFASPAKSNPMKRELMSIAAVSALFLAGSAFAQHPILCCDYNGDHVSVVDAGARAFDVSAGAAGRHGRGQRSLGMAGRETRRARGFGVVGPGDDRRADDDPPASFDGVGAENGSGGSA